MNVEHAVAAVPRAASDDRAYCRSALPRVSRTFAINIRLLGGTMRESVRVAYLLCRAADALEDSWPGDAQAIRRRFEEFMRAIAGDGAAAAELARAASALGAARLDLDLVANLPRVLRVFASLPPGDRAAILEGVQIMARGMSHYAARAAERTPASGEPAAYLDDERELHDYCWVVAGCVGVMLTRLFTHRSPGPTSRDEARRFELAPVVGESLQLTNVLLDWPIDVRRGRCHVPARWLAEFGLAPRDLVSDARAGDSGDAAGASEDLAPPGPVRAIASRLEGLARAALARVPDYLDTLPTRHVRYRLFCLWPSLWALASLENARRDPRFPWGPRRPRLPRGELYRVALGSFLKVRDGKSLRRLYAEIG